MDQPVSRLQYLFQRFVDKSCTDAERQEFLFAISRDENRSFFEQLISEDIVNNIDDHSMSNEKAAAIFENIRQQLGLAPAKVVRIFPWLRIAVAASVIGLLLVGSYFLFRNREKRAGSQESGVVSHDVKAPDVNRATITLADGKKVFLDSVANGTLAMQNNVSLVKTADGKIEYSSELKVQSSELAYNTLTNPRGSKVIDMTLADGSHVWLNAGSSITYPVAFIGDERKVSMTGEAYFEVAKKESVLRQAQDGSQESGVSKSNRSNGSGGRIPFIVEANGVTVQVLGTHFNVNAYNDEDAIRVTLLEGSVKVSKGSQSDQSNESGVRSQESVVIKPGQQAILVRHPEPVSGSIAVNDSPDLEEVMAWKNGKFDFGNKADLDVIMRQISRWYDVDVQYQGNHPPQQQFGGEIPRSSNLSQVLEILKTSGVQFAIEGRKVIVKS